MGWDRSLNERWGHVSSDHFVDVNFETLPFRQYHLIVV